MGNIIRWNNANTQATDVVIYRGITPLSPTALPAPYVTLTQGETSFDDSAVVYGTTYYYMLVTKSKDGQKTAASRNIVIQAGIGRGLGPNVLQDGTEQLGYFGLILSADFIPAVTITAAAAPGGPTLPTFIRDWYKFIRRGKILYIPSSNCGGVLWTTLYSAGFVYGRDDNGPVGGVPAVPVNQRRVVEWRGERYLVRLLRGYADPDSPVQFDFTNQVGVFDHDALPNTPACELNDLLYSLVNATPLKQRLPNQAFAAATSFSSSNNSIVCQEADIASAQYLSRWSSQNVTVNQNLRTHLTYGKAQPLTVSAGTCMWVPVLELIEE